MTKRKKFFVVLGGILLLMFGATLHPLSHPQPSIPYLKARSLERCRLLANALSELNNSKTTSLADLSSEDWPFRVYSFASIAPELSRHKLIEGGYLVVVESYAEEHPQFLSGLSGYWVVELGANQFAVCERFDIWGDSIGVAIASKENEETKIETVRMPMRKFCEWLKMQLLENEQKGK